MRYSTLTLLPALAAASPMFQVGTIHNEAAPVLSSVHAEEVPDSYMVVFKKHVKHADAQQHHDWVQNVHSKSENDRMELRKRSQFPTTNDVFDGLKHTYNIIDGLMGYSGHFDEETLEQIRRHPDVSPAPVPPSYYAITASLALLASLSLASSSKSSCSVCKPWRLRACEVAAWELEARCYLRSSSGSATSTQSFRNRT
jgi:hypothetical protein